MQIFWRSPTATTPDSIEDSIEIYRGGSFPSPGTLAQTIVGPVLTDGALNEWRYTDENNTVPISVPVTNGETIVIALTFFAAPAPNSGPGVVRDTDGITANGNAIYANPGMWLDAVTMSAMPARYTAGMPLQYTIDVANAGPMDAPATTLVDTFPTDFQNPAWTCTPTGGAICPVGGSGNIIGSASLPAGSSIQFVVDGTVASGATGKLTNSMTAVVNAPALDPDTSNNTATLEVRPDDTIFANGFEDNNSARPLLVPVPAGVVGR